MTCSFVQGTDLNTPEPCCPSWIPSPTASTSTSATSSGSGTASVAMPCKHLARPAYSTSNGRHRTLLHDLQPNLQIISFILLDPTIGDRSPSRDKMNDMMTHLTSAKVDTWPDRETAVRYLAGRPGTRNWHPEVLRLYAQKGLKSQPAPGGGSNVTLACTKAYECVSFLPAELSVRSTTHDCLQAVIRAVNHQPRAVEVLRELKRRGPAVHLILSAVDEFG